MKKKFWPIVGYAVLGSLAGSAIGYIIFKYPESKTITVDPSKIVYDPNRAVVDIKIN